MNWVNLRAWVNNPSTTLDDLRRAATGLGLGSGGTTAQLRARLNVFTDNQRRIHGDDAPAAFDPNPTPPAPIADAQPVQPVTTPAAGQAQPTEEVTAQPVRPAPRVAREQRTERTGGNGFMRTLVTLAIVGLIAFLGSIVIYERPWDEGPNGNGSIVATATATPAPTATAVPTQVPTAAPTTASPTASPTVIPTASETPAPTATATALTADDIARAVADALAKALANQPAAPTPSSSPSTSKPQSTVPGVTQSSENCPTTGEVQSAIGLSVVRIGTEACGFTWRSLPMTANGTCPSGWICTLHLSDDRKVVVSGTGQTLSIMAGTFRFPPAYPADDAVNAPNALCDLLAKEQEFGRIEDPSFKVEPMGFSCDGTSSSTDSTSTPQDPPANNDSVSECPKTAEEAASRVGGDPSGWKALSGYSNGWKYIGPQATFTVPATGVIDSPSGRSNPGQTATSPEITLWCPA